MDIKVFTELSYVFVTEPFRTAFLCIALLLVIDKYIVSKRDIFLFLIRAIKFSGTLALGALTYLKSSVQQHLSYIDPPSAREVKVAAWADLVITTLFIAYFFVYGILIIALATASMAAPEQALGNSLMLLGIGISTFIIGHIYRGYAYKIAKTKGINLYPWRKTVKLT